MNYALTLEYAFYEEGVGDDGKFSKNDFDDFEDRDPELFEHLQDIEKHEREHVEALIATIRRLGGDPVEELCYDFGYTDVEGFLAVAMALENTGVSAYDGAIADIKSAELQTTGATIATVEARHASYLNFINDENPFPDSFDKPLSMDEVFEIIEDNEFIVDCEG